MSKIEKFKLYFNCIRGAFQVTADNYTKDMDRWQRYTNSSLVFFDNVLSLIAMPTAAK